LMRKGHARPRVAWDHWPASSWGLSHPRRTCAAVHNLLGPALAVFTHLTMA
jgi:hypothetical protein